MLCPRPSVGLSSSKVAKPGISTADMYPILRAHLERGPLYKPRFHGSHSGSGSDSDSEDGHNNNSSDSGRWSVSTDPAEAMAIDALLNGFTQDLKKRPRGPHPAEEEEPICLLEVHTGSHSPHEITVSVEEEGLLIIQGAREEIHPCHGDCFNSFEFTKSYLLPPHTDVDSLVRVDTHGMLRIMYSLPPTAIPVETVRPFTSILHLDEETTIAPSTFQVYLGLYEYSPDEMAVRVEDDLLIVEASKVTPVNDGDFEGKEMRVRQSVTRRYLLPQDAVSQPFFCTIDARRGLSVVVIRKGHT